ncbi:MAG: hypothetical protein Q7J42_12710 [Sulfuritalea sp.]|nr:hypothetical protein [Sulfuritalea sp.]
MGLPRRDAEHHPYADYCSWPDDVRYELIDGVAYAMGWCIQATASSRSTR